MSILDLIQTDENTTLKRVSSTSGGEYAGACPFCGGRDRFRVWPKTGRYWCRGCGSKGDSIQFLRDRRGLTFLEACYELGVEPHIMCTRLKPIGNLRVNEKHPKDLSDLKSRNEFQPQPTKAAPCTKWQEQACLFLDRCQKFLWSDQGTQHRAWLNDRGVTPGTVEFAGLGFNPREEFHDRASWGLPKKLNERGHVSKVWLPAGLVIPYLDAESFTNEAAKLVRLRFRRANPGNGSRYILASGSGTRPMLVGPDHQNFLIVESELDALALWPNTAHLVTMVSIGSAQMKPDAELHEKLLKAERILVALDSDRAGAAASLWWLKNYKQARRWPVPLRKDPIEALQQGIDLQAWVQAGLEAYSTQESCEKPNQNWEEF